MSYQMPPLANAKEGWSYNWFEVMSALRKSIKLHKKEDAVYWVNVVLSGTEKGGAKSVAKQLWIMSTEDVYSHEIVLRAALVYLMADKVPETDQVYYLAAAMCDAPMWWESREGRMVDEFWAKAIGDLKDPARRKEIPEYALDRHTSRGWAAQKTHRVTKAGIGFDDRFSGTDLGRQKSAYMLQRDGFLSEDSEVFRFPDGREDEGFLAFWAERRLLQGMTSGDLEPNDPLGKDGVAPPPGELFSMDDSAEMVRALQEGRSDVDKAAGTHGPYGNTV
jgi:hypothetical protein